MNKGMLPKLKHSWVSLDPPLEQRGRGRPLDLQFFVEGASREELLLRETGSTMQLQVPSDHIHAYVSKPDRGDGQRRGVLSLNVQYFQNEEWGPIMFDPLRR